MVTIAVQSKARLAAIALAIVAFVVCYARVAALLVDMWSANPLYSYGFVLPFIAAYVAWVRWPAIRSADSTPDPRAGVAVVLVGASLLVVGRLAGLATLQECSLPLTLGGLVLLLFGRSVLAAVWFPIAYLALGMSIWNPVIAALQPPSRILSGRLATVVLQTVGVPALRVGTSIVLPNVTLDVWPECSGVNQVLAIVAMALPTVYLLLRGRLSRVGFVAFAIVVAYLSNGLRIALTGWLAYHGLGDGNLRGVHVLEGVAVSTFGYVLLFACLPLFARLGRQTNAADDRSGGAGASADTFAPRQWPGTAWTLAPIALLLSIGVGLIVLQRVQVRPAADLSALPTHVGAWTLDQTMQSRFPAFDEAFLGVHPTSDGERRFADVDEELVRSYRNAAGARLELYVGYRRSQEEGRELAGAVGRALDALAAPVVVAIGDQQVALNRVVQTRPSRRRGVLYWYDLNGRIVTNIYRVRAYALWDAITRRRTNGAILMVAWDAPADAASADAAQAHAVAFAQALIPLLSRYLPS